MAVRLRARAWVHARTTHTSAPWDDSSSSSGDARGKRALRQPERGAGLAEAPPDSAMSGRPLAFQCRAAAAHRTHQRLNAVSKVNVKLQNGADAAAVDCNVTRGRPADTQSFVSGVS